MPEIHKGDKAKNWIPMCINYVMKNEGLTGSQAAGKCNGMWREHLKNKKAKSGLTEEEAKEYNAMLLNDEMKE